MDYLAAGIELQHGVGVGLADSLKLLGCELQLIRQQQRGQGMPGWVDGFWRRGKRHGHWAAP